jgi:ADP-heptose:LPS heptosyltransferase
MIEPALRQLSQHFGAEQIHFLALKGGVAALAKASGLVAEVHSWDPDSQSKAVGWALHQKLRKTKWQWIIRMFPTGHWKYTLFLHTLPAEHRAGFVYPTQGLGRVIPRLLPQRQDVDLTIDLQAHDVVHNLRLAEALIALDSRTPPAHSEGDFAPSAILCPLEARAVTPLPSEAYLVLHPGSSAERGMEFKRLPPHVFGALARRIWEEKSWKTVLIGGPEEATLRAEVMAAAPGDFWLERPTRSLEDLAAVIQTSQMFLGNDSGLMHLASALQRPVLAFFGPTDEGRTGPWGAPGVPTWTLRQKMACAPCWTLKNLGSQPPCPWGDWRCLQKWDFEDLWNTDQGVAEFLNQAEVYNRAAP